MAQAKTPTPRDRVDQILDYVRRAKHYWWVVAIAFAIGGVASLVFALTRPPLYQSGAVLFYQERIQTGILQGRDAATLQRNIGERYRELLLARSSLTQIIQDPTLNPLPDLVKSEGVEAAVEDLRLAVGFEVRGSNTFRVVYADSDAKRAQKVTARLTELLLAKETEIRTDQSRETVKFAEEQKASAEEELRKRRRALAEFLDRHPEFAQDALEGAGEGAAVRARAANRSSPPPSGNPRLSAFERQRQRIRDRIAAIDNPGARPPVRNPANEAEVREAERELAGANRALEAVQARFTERHPDVVKAKEAVTAAQGRLRRAQSADAEELAPPSPADRGKLEAELGEVEKQINAERNRAAKSAATPTPPVTDETSNWVVQLETQYGELRQTVDEQRERVDTLADSVFRAELQANQQIAEGGANLTVVDPAFEPKKPKGKGKRVVVIAGMVLFVGIGVALALALAIIDDRLFRRSDIEHLGLAPVLAVVPRNRLAGRRA